MAIKSLPTELRPDQEKTHLEDLVHVEADVKICQRLVQLLWTPTTSFSSRVTMSEDRIRTRQRNPHEKTHQQPPCSSKQKKRFRSYLEVSVVNVFKHQGWRPGLKQDKS